jgi:hypothetical protein
MVVVAAFAASAAVEDATRQVPGVDAEQYRATVKTPRF